RILLGAGADVNSSAANFSGVTSLQVAAIKGYINVATILLDAGAEVNCTKAFKYGRTALEGAAEHGRMDMVQLLLNAGAGRAADGSVEYRSAVELASDNGHYSVRRLIESSYESGIVT
ncbi:ankyrin, partial [Polyplosphaeria fusca]